MRVRKKEEPEEWEDEDERGLPADEQSRPACPCLSNLTADLQQMSVKQMSTVTGYLQSCF